MGLSRIMKAVSSSVSSPGSEHVQIPEKNIDLMRLFTP